MKLFIKKKAIKFYVLFWIAAIAVVGSSSAVVTNAAVKSEQVTDVKVESLSYKSVRISWKANKKVSGYEIYRSTKRKGPYKKIKTISKWKTVSYTDKKVTCGTRYYYKICSRAGKEKTLTERKFSEVVSVKPVPVKPVISSVVSKDSKTVEVKWKAVSGASGYFLYKSSEKQGPYKRIASVKKPSRTAKAAELSTGYKYYFKVRAYRTVDGKKVLGDYSDAMTGFTVPDAPEIGHVQLKSKTSAKLSWKYSSGSGYYIYRRSLAGGGYSRIGSVDGSMTREFIDNYVVDGNTYYYKVSAFRLVDGKAIEGGCSKEIELRAVSSYTVSPDSEPYGANHMGNANYNPSTKVYYTLLSYFELFERIGGGELCLQAGTYNLWKPLYIPSNTTIRFSDGVVIKNSVSEQNNHELFVLASQADMKSGKKYTQYNGVHDVKLLGSGSVIFDKEYKKNVALVMAHTTNVVISGITFKNMWGDSHFIELDASKDVEIVNCTFQDSIDVGEPKEAINLDTPDSNTGGFSHTFSSMDQTPNQNIVIHNNVFRNLPAAIGTHMYSDNKMHSGIYIENNRIENCGYFGIRALNWKDSVIRQNTITGIKANEDYTKEALAVEMRGVSNIEVSQNTVSDSDRFMVIKVAKYSAGVIALHPGLASYHTVYNNIEQEKLVHNTLSGITNVNDIYFSNQEDYEDRMYWDVVN